MEPARRLARIHRMRIRIALLIVVVALAHPFRAGPVMAQEPRVPRAGEIRAQLDLLDGHVQQLKAPAGRGEPLRLTVILDGESAELVLQPISVRAAAFRVTIAAEGGRIVEQPAPEATTWRGIVEGRPRVIVAASIIDGGIRARIVEDERQWFIQPVRGEGLHVVYRARDIDVAAWRCGTIDEPILHEAARGDTAAANAGAAVSGGACIDAAQIAFDADVEFFLSRGGSISNTVADIESIVNAANVIYERDVGIRHVITEIIVRTSEPDPYASTDAFALLGEFRGEWNTNFSAGSANPIPRDLAHLMTGKVLDNSVGGVASVGVVCSTNDAYAVSRSSFTSNFGVRVALTSHEMGHNWGASHCDADGDCAIMCSRLGGCSGVIDRFGSRTIANISSFRDSRGCLDAALPMGDDCNFNCTDDAQELSSGTAPDCNGNGVIDTCDIAAGTADDCDGNSVPDDCEDCDGNGLADVCDLSAAARFDSPLMSPIGAGADGLFTISDPPVRRSDVTVTIRAVADLASPGRFIECLLNGVSIGIAFDNTNGTGRNCPSTPDTAIIVVPRADFDALVGEGAAAFRLRAPNSSASACGGASYAAMTVEYETVNDRDSDSNGILDSCECPADCATAGPDATINVADLLDLLANWGDAPAACDIAPNGGDGIVNADDLLAVLAAWGSCAP